MVFGGKYTQTKPLTWEEHYIFMTTRGRWWKWFIILVNDFKTTRKVGVINFGELENWNPEFNFYIGETSLDNKTIEQDAMQLAIEWLKDKGYQKLHTTILDTNERWIESVEDLGFVNVGVARKGESTWEKYIAGDTTCTEYITGRRAF